MTYQRPPRRRLPALLRRSDDHAQGRRDRRDPRRGDDLDVAVATRWSTRQTRRRPRQHHRRRCSGVERDDEARREGATRSGRGRSRRASPLTPSASGVRRLSGPAIRERAAPRPRRGRRAVAACCASWCRRSCARGAHRAAASTARARSTSSAPTRPAGSRSTAAFPTTCRWASSLYSEVYASADPGSVAAGRSPDGATNHELRSHDDAVRLLDDLESAAAPTSAAAAAGGNRDDRRAGNQTARRRRPVGAGLGRRQAGRWRGTVRGGRGQRCERSQPRAARRSSRSRSLSPPASRLCFIVRSDHIANVSLIYGAYFLASASPPTSSSASGCPNADPTSSRCAPCWRRSDW